MVDEFAAAVRAGRSLVRQMIMGAGKTTVIAPLLVLLVSSGDCLVTQCVPRALLHMSVSVLRRAFGTVLSKEVFQLSVNRTSLVTLADADVE